ncbi:MAG: Outer membrane protein TolC precursor [Syntrophorhabdus sp. PtaU1.Bin002]|nr:MAG: Outer membrane protein TolC precursor [Syntrophorhabdus sp. PtaU1.Bin002]
MAWGTGDRGRLKLEAPIRNGGRGSKDRMKGKIMKKAIVVGTLALLVVTSAWATEYSLDDLLRIALERSERIKISDEDVYIAERTKDKAMSLLLPKLSAVGNYVSYNESKISNSGSFSQPKDRTGFELRLDQSMSLGGKEITALRITKQGIEKSKQDLYAVKEAYLLNVAAAYYDALRIDKLIQIARANVDRLGKYRDAATTRLRVGEVTKTAVLRAEAELSGARTELIRSENSYKLAKAVLARTVGIENDYELREEQQPPDEKNGKPDTVTVVRGCEPITVECLKEKAEAERAELKSLYTQKKIAEDQVRFAQGSYWPTLAVEGVYAKKDESPETGGLVRDSAYGGVRLTFPFFEGGLRRAEVLEAEAKKRQAEYSLADMKKSIGVEVESAYLDYMTQKGVLKSVTDQVLFSRQNYSAVSRQFEFGLVSSLDVLDANTSLVDSERQLTNVMYIYQFSMLRLRRVTGTLLKDVSLAPEIPGKTNGLSSAAKEIS